MTIAYSGKTADPKSYYVCMSQRSNTYLYSDQERCTARRIPTDVLDKAVYEHLSQLSDNPRLIKQYVMTRPNPASSQNLQNALERLKDNEDRLLKQREMVLRWYRQQMITDEDAERQLTDIRTRLDDISQNKHKLRAELSAISPFLTPSEVVATIQAHFDRSEPPYEDKRAAVRSVLEKVTVERKDNTKARSSKPDLHIELKFL